MKILKKLTIPSKIVFVLWTIHAIKILLSGKSGVNFIQWVILWLFGTFIFVGITQFFSKKKSKKNFRNNTLQFQNKNNANQENQTSKHYDLMDGHQFEYFCADVLRKNNFSNVEVTRGSGDHGIDILAEKDSITYAIQCKCYSSNIGNAAVQQAHTGKSLYHKDIAVVLTNRYFTPQAKEEAAALGVKLWDRDKLNSMIEKANS